MCDNQKLKEKPYNNKLWIIYIILFSTILTPSIKIGNLPAFRIEQVIVVVFAIYFFIGLTLRKKIKKNDIMFPLLYSGFSFFIILSILVGSFKGIKVIVNDFFEIYKIFIYLGIYLITILIVESEDDKFKILSCIKICLVISLIISIQQYFNLFNLNEKYVPIIAPTQFRTLVNNYPYPRVVGMTSNPNVYSVMPSIGAIISWSMYLATKSTKNLIFMIIFVFGTLMTLSRSGFIFMLAGIGMCTFFFIIKSNNGTSRLMRGRINIKAIGFIILAIFIIFTLGIIVFNYLPEELTWRLKRGLNLESDSSFQARLRNWGEHIEYFKSSPIFGLGPAKSIDYKAHVDNEWLLFLRQYGIVGTLYFVSIFVLPFLRSKNKFYKYLYYSVLVGSALYMIPAIIYNSFQLMPIIMILAGLVSSSRKSMKE